MSIDRPGLVAVAVELFCRCHPKTMEPYPSVAHAAYIRDMREHLLHVAGAISVNSLDLLVDYLLWVRRLFANFGLPADDLRLALGCLAEALEGGDGTERMAELLRQGRDELDRQPPGFREEPHSGIPLSGMAERYLMALLTCDRRLAERVVIGSADEGTDIAAVYMEVIAPAMRKIGRLWHANRISTAQEHYASSLSQEIMSRLYPRVFATPHAGPVLVATCVEGELHELGMRMVADVFQMEGWDTRFLGANTPAEAVVAFAHDVGAAVVGISAMTAATVPAVTAQIALLRDGPGGRERKILVGGHPFTVDGDLWRHVGADGTASDARLAVTVANRLVDAAR